MKSFTKVFLITGISAVLFVVIAITLLLFSFYSQKSPIQKAIDRGDLEYVRNYLSQGGDPNLAAMQRGYEYSEWITLLMDAAAIGQIPIMELLVNNGANINAESNKKNTALTKAIAYGEPNDHYPAAAVWLIEHGAKVDFNVLEQTIKNSDKFLNPSARQKFIKLLLDHGAPITGLNSSDLTPLMIAVQYRSPDIIQILLDHGSPINEVNSRGIAPLMLAAISGSPEIVQMLLDHGADKNIKSEDGTALDFAKKHYSIKQDQKEDQQKYEKIIEMLEQK